MAVCALQVTQWLCSNPVAVCALQVCLCHWGPGRGRDPEQHGEVRPAHQHLDPCGSSAPASALHGCRQLPWQALCAGRGGRGYCLQKLLQVQHAGVCIAACALAVVGPLRDCVVGLLSAGQMRFC